MNVFQNRQFNAFFSFLCLLSILSMVGCVDLSVVRSSVTRRSGAVAHSEKKVLQHRASKLYQGEVHTMLGGLGIFSTGMRTLSDSLVQECAVSAPSDMWYNAGAVSRSIMNYYYKHKIHRPIVLVGHSLGANEQIKVARNLDKAGIPVDLLITVDAVSQTLVPPNVKQAMNFYKPGYVPMLSGLKLRAVNPKKTHIDNINVAAIKGVYVNHFTIDKSPVVQAMIIDEVKKVLSHAKSAKA